ncbi:MAG: hemerythrin domain-containing protein [Polaromonas sp.]
MNSPARQAARGVMRYFDLAAPLHHQDEELHVFPPLLAGPDVALRELVQRLMQDHRQMEMAWGQARRTLMAIAESTESGWTPLTPSQTAALNQFAALYRQHLDDENNTAYPRRPSHPVASSARGDERRNDAAPGCRAKTASGARKKNSMSGCCPMSATALIEVGRKQPTLSVLLRLAEGLQYPLADFMGRVQQRYLLEKAAMRSEQSISTG